MPGRDFEKAIQEKAQQLRLDPSPAVWQGVAEQLQKRRRKRGAAWFLVAAAVISGLIAVWMMPETALHPKGQSDMASHETTQSNAENSGKSIQNQPNIEQNSTQNASETNLPSNDVVKPVPVEQEPVTSVADANVDAPAGTKAGSTPGTRNPGNRTVTARKSADRPGRNTAVPASPARGSLTAPAAADDSAPATAGLKESAAPRELFPSIVNGLPKGNHSSVIAEPKADKGDRTLASGLIKQEKISSPVPKGWYPSVHVVGGASALQENVLTQYNTFANEYQNVTMIPSGLAAPQRRPSDVKTGAAFQVGINVHRYLGKKISVGTGLHYMYLSNKIEIGGAVDTAYFDNRQQQMVNTTAYAGSGNSGSTFHNRYHLLQVPLEFNWNIDRKQRLAWNGGIAFGYLVGSDAMQYNKQAGIYYRDNDALRKWQAGVFSGIQYSFLETKGMRFAAGPFVQYQLSSLEVVHTNKHQLFVGLGARMHLKPW